MEKRRRIPVRSKTSPGGSLKQRLQNHARLGANAQPKDSTMTCLAISFIWGNTFILLLEGFAVLIPSYHVMCSTARDGTKSVEYGKGFIAANVVSIWLLLEVVYHWWFLRDGESNVVKKSSKEKYFKTLSTPPGWIRCSVCKLDAPPRSHHCKACNKCILKRDHHCYFSGSCVGLHNQRHFIFFLVYVSIACSYAVIMQIIYIAKQESPMYLVPLVAMWRTVTLQGRQLSLLILLHMYTSLIALFGAISFLAWQIWVIYHGQTSYEVTKSKAPYRKTPEENVRIVFGSPLQCFITFFLPIRLSLPHDGISWT